MNAKMKSRRNFILLKVAGLLAAILLFSVPDYAVAYEYETVLAGDTMDVSTAKDYIDVKGTVNVNSGADVDCLMVSGEVNMYSGSRVTWIYAVPGCTINIYGGSVSDYIMVWAGLGDEPDPLVTVYGGNFEFNGIACAPPPTEFTLQTGGNQLKGTYCGGGDIDLLFHGRVPIYLDTIGPEVLIDVKPGSDTNVINLKSKGVVPVAILTTGSFDAGTVDPGSVQFAQAAPVRWTLDDVDGDGDKDMLLHFKTQDLNLVSALELSALSAQNSEVSATAAKKAKLTGKTADGYQVSGTDSVRIISSNK